MLGTGRGERGRAGRGREKVRLRRRDGDRARDGGAPSRRERYGRTDRRKGRTEAAEWQAAGGTHAVRRDGIGTGLKRVMRIT